MSEDATLPCAPKGRVQGFPGGFATVSYLGPGGTFSEAAALAHFGSRVRRLPCADIDEVFQAVRGTAARSPAAAVAPRSDAGIVPLENSTEGAVNTTADCLIHSDLLIVGERVLPIELCLLARPGSERSGLTEVTAHQQALAQCRHWLRRALPEVAQTPCASNAEAARRASGEAGVAAVAGRLAGQAYGLATLAAGIQDRGHNSTRFIILAREAAAATGRDKTSLIVHAENRPGALFRILEPFENLGISLTRIETRPSPKQAWAYLFFMDFEGHVDNKKVQTLMERLRRCTAEIKLLGSYPRDTGEHAS